MQHSNERYERRASAIFCSGLKEVRGFGAENCTFPGKKRAKFLKTSNWKILKNFKFFQNMVFEFEKIENEKYYDLCLNF